MDNMDKEEHKFKDLNKFSKDLGKFVARVSGYRLSQIKKYIKVNNVKNIVKKYAKYNLPNNIYTLSEDDASEACEEILDWLVGVELASLAADDVLDCWWDDEKNQMMFEAKK
tara:strand:- start:877 stop:1212 length:336 start_codon:yes stop_codon:yes gene_type:complete